MLGGLWLSKEDAIVARRVAPTNGKQTENNNNDPPAALGGLLQKGHLPSAKFC